MFKVIILAVVAMLAVASALPLDTIGMGTGPGGIGKGLVSPVGLGWNYNRDFGLYNNYYNGLGYNGLGYNGRFYGGIGGYNSYTPYNYGYYL